MPTHADGASSFTGAIATPHALATDAAVGAFKDGGSAIDAAIAAAAVLTVVYPHNVALGGDLIALVRDPEGRVTCVNASGWAGAAVDADTVRAKHGTQMPDRGADTVTVPGGIRGWETLSRLGGRLPWTRLLEPAERAAGRGVPVARSVAAHLLDPENDDLIGLADFDRVFRPNGRPLGQGEHFEQPALAATLGMLRDAGPDEFYVGALAARTVDYLRSLESVLTADDFADFQPELTDPISVQFCGLTVSTSPPNTHGFVMLRALAAISELDTKDPLGDGIATLMRIFHHGNVLRSTQLADPRTDSVDIDSLVYGDLSAVTPLSAAGNPRSVPSGDTVGIAAADSDGFAVSLIQSVFHAFGSGLVDPQTGILFHDRGTSFSLDPTSPNCLAPRKRPLHTLMPVLTTQDGEIRHVLSTMGGQGQPQILTEIFLRILNGASASDAVAAPRAIVGHQILGMTADSVVVEADADAAVTSALAESGLTVVEAPRHTEGLGQANVVAVTQDGRMSAAADPRADGSAVVAQYARHHRSA